MSLKLPFGIAQIGKAFRNEITTEHFTFRSCEFEQMEMQYFVKPEEDEKFYNITAELPGMDKGDLEITIQDGKLEIKGEQKEETTEEKEGELIRREYHSSSYYRAFSLPENIDENAVEANLDKGLLKVRIPKIEPPEPVKKKIEIK